MTNKPPMTFVAPLRATLGALAASLALAGCSLIPTYERPAAPVPFSASTAATALARKGEGDRLRPISSNTMPAST